MSALGNVTHDDVSMRGVLAIARPIFAAALWSWYESNKDRVIISKWGFITIHVSAVRWVLEELAGPEFDTSPTQGQ